MGENPCNIFEKLIKSTLNFFGYGNNHISNFVVSSYSHQQQQEEDITSMVFNLDQANSRFKLRIFKIKLKYFRTKILNLVERVPHIILNY